MIGELAAKTGLTTKAIRFYEAQSLLQMPQRTAGGYRDYGEDALGRISFIRAGQAIGFTLGELREVIAFRDQGQAPCSHVAALLEQKAAEVEERIMELVQLRDTLQGLREQASHLDPAECPPTTVCHLIFPSRQRAKGIPSGQPPRQSVAQSQDKATIADDSGHQAPALPQAVSVPSTLGH